MDRILAKNANRIKTLEERLHDAEDQAIQASRRVRDQYLDHSFLLNCHN